MTTNARETIRTVLLTVSGAGESGLGIVLLAAPDAVLPFFLKDPPTSSIVFVARSFGVAVLALGVSWWNARATLAGHRASRLAYVLFNLGIAGVAGAFASFGMAGMIAVLWAIALLHAVFAIAYVVATESPVSP